MENYLAKCGCDCRNCPSFKENLRTGSDRQCCSQGWEKHLGFKLSPEKLRACDGCSLPDEDRNTFYLNCLVRKCALINQVDHCGYCIDFPCQELMKVHSLQLIPDRQAFMLKTEKWISADDYLHFVEPYTGLVRLKSIRKKLPEEELKPFKPFSVYAGKALHLAPEKAGEQAYFIRKLLGSVLVEQNIPYARQQALLKKRENILRLLWTVSLLGNLEQENSYLEIGSQTLTGQKIPGIYTYLPEYLEILEEYDVHGEIVPRVTQGWLTASGALRKKGWVLRLRFGNTLDGKNLPGQFQRYTRTLETAYKSKAFSRFKMADTRVLDTLTGS